MSGAQTTTVPDVVEEAVREIKEVEGSVSAYVYRPELAALRAARLRDAVPRWAEVFYAVKANGFPPLLHALAPAVDGFEVASQHEADLVADATEGAARMIASGPGKSEANIDRLIELGVEIINVESVLELRRVAHLADRHATRARVALRIHPHSARIARDLVVGRITTPFGIDEGQVGSAVEVAAGLPAVDVVGFHFHLMCNSLDAAQHGAFVDWCLRWSADTAARHGLDLQVVDVGGGLGAPGPGQEELDLGRLAESLEAIRVPSGVRVIFEPGRWIVDECGYYAAEVTDLKRINETWFAVLRGGIHHFFRPAAYGTRHACAVVACERWDYPFVRPEVRDVPVTVVGELCTAADVLARDVAVSRLRVGDAVVFPRAGSYGWEMSLQEFLGHPRAHRVVAAPRDGRLADRPLALDGG